MIFIRKNIANELKKLDIEIARKLFAISKERKIPDPPGPLQGRIMDYLIIHQGEKIYQKDLEKALNISKATISSALFSMEKSNIIKRITSKNDARSREIILTEDSKKAHENMKLIFENLNKELTKNISKEEIDMFYSIIEKLRMNIK